jgi:hypothetical protein
LKQLPLVPLEFSSSGEQSLSDEPDDSTPNAQVAKTNQQRSVEDVSELFNWYQKPYQ